MSKNLVSSNPFTHPSSSPQKPSSSPIPKPSQHSHHNLNLPSIQHNSQHNFTSSQPFP
ncbi:hypothetical protein M431DRAFT_507841 [Trichoderma harzianum CBS 226.95]|uniref:Uncharacterized protein n=1 Tax=Trichoderma harzianum CBS 226.95 TaxID=983964 RepID=A0A2T4AGH0_TRIHA|nr:hypothetical protein M431DRAFT_507841 [Trichoderma harzianum CBS 226.95]PTB56185.1 hypothetical protein M431DRAFT_507841 [Trichoderma harzianum CBS 226.95]